MNIYKKGIRFMKKMYSSIDEAIRDLFGNERSVARRRRITGGDINEACELMLDDGRLCS